MLHTVLSRLVPRMPRPSVCYYGTAVPVPSTQPEVHYHKRVSWDDASEAHIWRDKSLQANFSSTRPFLEEFESRKSL
ncbi:hypothetical protein ATANTOWER_020729 [Ataeniobius toweri]|uniref:Uncharacterized protein n=1 Tax=Ataeniobius toweri TaxID=208326 RepID=A0ABU7AR76_9TELE|nr:hypothetical protein [Ataeniobius toweri]